METIGLSSLEQKLPLPHQPVLATAKNTSKTRTYELMMRSTTVPVNTTSYHHHPPPMMMGMMAVI